MSRISAISASLFLSIVLTACSRSNDDSSAHSFRVFSENGTTIAENEGGPKYLSDLFTFEPILRLNEDPENEESLLFRPGVFTMDQDGNFYVLDSGNSRIAVFDMQGDFVRSFGREGQGPGEFTGMDHLLIQGDVVSIYDYRIRRRTFYRTDGFLLDVISVPATVKDVSLGSMMDLQLLDDDRLFLLKWQNRRIADAEFFRAGTSILDATPDTIWTLDTPWVQNGIRAMQPSGVTLSFSLPFVSIPRIHCVHGRGILLSNGTSQELIWYDPDGTPFLEIRLGLPTEPFTSEDRNKQSARFRERIAEARQQDNDRRAMMYETELEAFYFPPHKPFWSDTKLDNMGYLWLRVPEHVVDREAAGGGYLYRIISPEGEYLGDTRITYSTRFNIVDGRLLVNWTPPESDEQELLVCEIKSAVRGFSYP